MKGKKVTVTERNNRLAHDQTERRRVFKSFCAHLARGYSFDSFPELSDTSIRSYIKSHPEDFIEEELNAAKRQGKAHWEEIGYRQASGSCLGNSRSWYYNMANRYGWREKIDIEAEHKGQVSVNVISYASTKQADSVREGE